MNYITATFLSLTNNEELSFWLFYVLIERYELRSLYLPGVPDLHMRNYMLSQIIKDYMPWLFHHLKRVEMSTDYFTSKWIMTLYSNFLPLRMMPAVMDNFLLEGWTAIYRLAIALLWEMESIMLTMDMEQLSKYLRDQTGI